jgi:membrane fusion protein
LVAPESGTISAIRPVEGSRVEPSTPILSIIPPDSPLEIELLLPTRAAGFIKIGDEVKVRFDAFPYQKFGVVKGKVRSFDRSVILPLD